MLTWGKLLGLPLEVRAFEAETAPLPSIAGLAPSATAQVGDGSHGGGAHAHPEGAPEAATPHLSPALPPAHTADHPASRATPRSAHRLAWLNVRLEAVPRRHSEPQAVPPPPPDPTTDAAVRAIQSGYLSGPREDHPLARLSTVLGREALEEASELARAIDRERWGRWLVAYARALLAATRCPLPGPSDRWVERPWYLPEQEAPQEIAELGFANLALCAADPQNRKAAQALSLGMQVASSPFEAAEPLSEPAHLERLLERLGRQSAAGVRGVLDAGSRPGEPPALLALIGSYLRALGPGHALIHGTEPRPGVDAWFWPEGSQALRQALATEDKLVMESALARRPRGGGAPLAMLDHPASPKRARELLGADEQRDALATFALYMLPAVPVVCPGLRASGALRALNALWERSPALSGRRVLRLENGHKGMLSWVKAAESGAARLLLLANLSAHSARPAFSLAELRAALGLGAHQPLRLGDALHPGRSVPLRSMPGKVMLTVPPHGFLALEAH